MIRFQDSKIPEFQILQLTYNNCHSSRQPLFIVNPHFLPTRNIPLEQKSQSQSTAQQPEPGPL
jgi:hypothetical protein